MESTRDSDETLQSLESHVVIEDCIRLLERLPDNCVDLIHTSPPYNIDRPYDHGVGDRTSTIDYEEQLAEAIFQLKRVLRPGGSMFWQTGYTQPSDSGTGDILPIDIISYRYFREHPIPMDLWDRIIWRYWGGHAFRKKFTNKHETILWFVKQGKEPVFEVDRIREKAKEYDKRNNLWGRNPGNVWEVDRVAFGSIEQTSHIAVFPEELSERIIRACSHKGDLVLDPFSGSGTAAKVARSLSRRWIGIEISSTYATESAIRIGFQQPSETASLVSELLKAVAFQGKKGTLSVEEIAGRLSTWARPISTQPIVERFNEDISAAIADTTRSKDKKRAAWLRYDRKIESKPGTDMVVLADRLLLRSYKNRRNLNGVTRYRTALETLDDAASRLQTPVQDLCEYVYDIVSEEPSSYDIRNGLIALKTVDRRIRSRQKSASDHPSRDAEMPIDPDSDRESHSLWQGRLPL